MKTQCCSVIGKNLMSFSSWMATQSERPFGGLVLDAIALHDDVSTWWCSLLFRSPCLTPLMMVHGADESWTRGNWFEACLARRGSAPLSHLLRLSSASRLDIGWLINSLLSWFYKPVSSSRSILKIFIRISQDGLLIPERAWQISFYMTSKSLPH